MEAAKKIWAMMRKWEYAAYCIGRRCRLRNKDFTIISSNCVGGVIYHDLGLKFRTPTVNLTISMSNMVRLAENLKWYMDQELVRCPHLEEKVGCPVGLLGGIPVNFVHYKTFKVGKEKWDERKRRINWDRIVIIGTERGDCDYETLRAFDSLPWPNKVVFTHVDYPEFSSAYHIHGFEDEKELGGVVEGRPQRLFRRYIDEFDYVSFLNQIIET